MNILRFFHKTDRKGFTLMETLVTVGIVAVLCAIAIPSIITLNRSMKERDLNNSARAVYLAAQSNLAQMRSSGDLAVLAAMTELDGARSVPENNNAGMGEWNEQLRYTVTDTKAFDLVLPANVLDSQLREQQILIEYNPFSGHVYAVFYSEGEQVLSYSVIGERPENDSDDTLVKKGIGYYYGGSVTISPAEVNSTAVTLSADTDGQELIASVIVPVPESYINQQDKFREYLSAELTIRGEMSGAELVIPTDSLSLKKELCIGSPNYVEFTFVLDSLKASNAFSELNDEFGDVAGVKTFIPGENLTLTADIQFDAPENETILTFDEVVITGVNSLFSNVEVNADGTYVIELSNGRHLQNLNALADSIAANVTSIKLVDDIYWNETVEYYTDAYVTQKMARAAEAVDFEYFTPLDTSVFTGASAVFDGGKHRILYLNINAETGDAGLFSVCNLAQVKDLAIVSPTVSGAQNVGALAGAANGVTFSNCSVYIDTEDEYFSWDMMDKYGVTSSGGNAGGLVGYAINGSFTNCFAAVNVDAEEYAGGFVGSAKNVAFTGCYASGDVEGEIVGGFVGLNDNSNFTQCFASGDVEGVDIAGGFTGKMECTATSGTYNQCYAVGSVKVSAENGDADGFCGTSNLDEKDENDYNIYETTNEKTGVYSKTYYLSDSVTTKESYYANSASYAQLAGEKDENNFTVLGWTDKAFKTHSYSLVKNGEYPFLVYSNNLHYYGEWPEEECPVALAYYEKYEDDEKSETKEIGFYISGESDSTLQNDRTIVEDGYVLLCQTELSGKTEVDWAKNELPEAYHIYNPINLTNANSNSGGFYDAITVTINNSAITLYYNADFALSQLNPVVDESGKFTSARLPNTASNVPSKIYIRTARHLAAIAENETYQGSGYNYVQMLDVDFGTYNWGTSNNVSPMKSIASFAGTYTGTGGYVSQAKITLDTGITLFGTITGKVSHVDVVSGDLGNAEAGFVTNNEGEIVNCTMGPAGITKDSGKTAGTGLTYGFAKLNSGTIQGCMANTAATAAAFVGTNSGTVADCYAWYPGTAADGDTKIVFAKSNDGEIVSSYAAIYEKLGENGEIAENAYVLVYDRDGAASFRNTLEGITLGENWYSYSEEIRNGRYQYSIPEGITHRGGWSEFAKYEAFTGYYYYETYEDEDIGVYIDFVDQPDEEPVYRLKDTVPVTTGYGIFTITPNEMADENLLEQAALTLNSAPIVPAELDTETYKEDIEKIFKDTFDTSKQTNTYVFKELSSQSVYVLNGTEINTWFAPANEDGAYRIRTAEQFAAIEKFSSESFTQETDITIAAPLAYFEGTYDGGENILRYDSEKPLTVTLDAANGEEEDILDANDNVTGKKKLVDNVAWGLFANVTGERAVIKNCRVVDAAITIMESAQKATESITGIEITASIGGLVGENHGTIKTSSVEGLKVTYTAVDSTTLTEGTSYTANIAIGGLVGRMADGRLDECFVTGEIKMAADSADCIGGAVGIVDAEEDASVTCMDSYAAVNISASGATVGAFVGKAENGLFYYCHGWNGGAFIGSGADHARLLKCYYAQAIEGTYKIWTYDGSAIGSLSYESLTQWINSLNDDRGDIWDTETTFVDDNGVDGETYGTKYPVLAGRYDANAVGESIFYVEETVETVKAAAATEAPTETAEPEATPETTPEATEQPEVTAEPETTEEPVETAEPEITPEPTAEPTPVPTETPAAEVTPEPTAETEPAGEEA